MKNLKKFILIGLTVPLISCSSLKELPFSRYSQWNLNRESGEITNTADSTIFSFYNPKQIGEELVNREKCDYGAPFITSTNYDKENIFSKYIAECLKSIPCHIDSIWFVLNDEYIVFEFTEDQILFPHYEFYEDGRFYGLLTENSLTQQKQKQFKQTPNIIWRNIVFSKRAHRLIAIDRLIIGNKHIGIAYILQSKIDRYPFCAYCLWDVTDFRNVEMMGIVLDKYKNASINNLKRNKKNK
jgi:hypothetical protein